MKLLFDFFPILLFFISYKIYGIYFATLVAVGASILQVIIFWYNHRRMEVMHIITLAIMVILGGATIIFHNEWFIKWKPTAINWLLAVIFLVSQRFAKKPLLQTMMENSVELPKAIWARLNSSWVVFFVAIGAANLYVAYHYDTNSWVNFKLFGVVGLTLLFVIGQAVYMAKYMPAEE